MHNNVLVGIASWYMKYDNELIPDAFTNVYHYRGFIKATMA